MAQELEIKTEQTAPSIADIIADLYRQIRQPYRWEQVRALLPLFFLRLAATVVYVLSAMGLMAGGVTRIADFLLNTGSAVCLFFLAKAHTRYRNAAITMTVSLLITVLSVRLGSPPLLTVMAGLCVLISNFFEYSGHSIVASKQSGNLAYLWDKLFLWVFGAAFFGAFAFLVILILSYLFESLGFLTIIITYLPDLVVDILYLVYLILTIRLVKKQKEE